MTQKIDFKSPLEVGFTFEKPITFSTQEISTFAKLCGDLNPLHHDPERAKSSRYGGIIACGPHTSAVYLSTMTAFLAPKYLGIGIKSEFEFCKPIYPNIELTIKWVVRTIIPKPRLHGYIVVSEGGIYNNDEELLLGRGTFIITEK
ncbi:MAG: MaoC family dehydratase [Thermodesulfobacteriota bacterium]